MSITGRYVYDKHTRKLVRVSNRADVSCVSYWCPDGGYWDHNISEKDVFIRDRRHKKSILEEYGLKEIG